MSKIANSTATAGRLATALFGVALALSTAATAKAADYRYDHNGSTMRVSVEGPDVAIRYERPRSGLGRIGVRPGTLLFSGRVDEGYLEGESRIFNAKCGEQPYFVYGDFQPGQSFRLSGAAPVLDDATCRIVDNVSTGSNANLAFTALGGSRPAPAPVAGSGCVTGVRTTLNVRVGPGSSYGRIAELPANSCGIEVRERCQDGFCLIRRGSTMGWVSMRYVQR